MIGLNRSAANHSTKELEHQTDIRLFDRTIHEVMPTEAGQQLTGRPERLSDELTITLHSAGRVDQQISGTVKVVASRTISTHLIPQYIAHSNRRYPDIDSILHGRPRQWALESIRHGEVGFGIMIDFGPAADLQYEVVLAEPFLLLYWEDHPFIGLAEVPWQVLQDGRLILQGCTSDSHPLIDMTPSRLAVRVNTVQEIGHPATLFSMVGSGVGINVLPMPVLSLPQGNHLTVKRLTLMMERQLMLVCRENRSLPTTTQTLWEIVHEEETNLTAMRVEDSLYQR